MRTFFCFVCLFLFVFLFFVFSNVDGQGTQSIIKNLNFKKSKMF